VWNLAYRQTAAEIEREFQRNRDLHSGRIQCRRGCTDCCHQLFQITEIEAAMVSAGVRELDPEVQRRIRARASGYIEARRAMVSHGEPEAWGQLPPPGSRLLCPLLEDGACLIYDHRPLLCRKFGIPLWNPDRPGRVYACELNFRDGDEISDPELIQIQTGIHERWKQVQVRYNAAGGRRFGEAITVARAVLEDFSALESDGPRTAS
jgi:Fe-S-cluster containining protein